MAKKTAADAAEPAGSPQEGSRGKGLLAASMVVAVAMVLGGAFAGGLIGGGGSDAAAAATPAPTPTPEELGMLVELQSLTINLADGRFLKVGAAVELAPDVAEEPPVAPIYDAMIAEFNSHTVEQLTDPGVRAATKDALLARLADTYGEQIVGVYYTEFVMQ